MCNWKSKFRQGIKKSSISVQIIFYQIAYLIHIIFEGMMANLTAVAPPFWQ